MLKSDGNFVLVASGSLESEGVEKLIEIVNDLLIEAVQLGRLCVSGKRFGEGYFSG